MEPGWRLVEEALRREASPEKLEQLQSIAEACASAIRVFLARRAVIEVFGQELDLDLLRSHRSASGSRRCATSSPSTTALAEMSQEAEPDEDGFVPPDWMLPLPRALRLPPLDLEELKPDPDEIQRMREPLAVPDEEAWWQAAVELGDTRRTQGDVDPDLKERVRRRGRELGSTDGALGDIDERI